jgi:2-desacetyl-2-hydroxyethyl bacteriochlorophyllide A dehydrogenase
MRQIVLREPGEFVAEDVPQPVAAEGEALVRVHRVGVCGTDLHAFRGKQPYFEYPRVLGHELGVEVVEAPENDRGIKPGDHCAVEPYLTCGTCFSCRRGSYNTCENIRTLGVHIDGAMRTFFTIPVKNLHRSEKLELEQLALVETLGVGAHAVDRAEVGPDDEILVVGAGPIGLAAIQFAKAEGMHVRAYEINPRRREFVEQLGVETLTDTDGLQADVVIDATGHPKAMEASFDLVRVCGTLVFVGLYQGRISFDDPAFNKKEMTIRASRNSADIFPKLIQLIEDGKIDTKPWITHRMPLAAVPQDFPTLYEESDLVKAVIEVEGDD